MTHSLKVGKIVGYTAIVQDFLWSHWYGSRRCNWPAGYIKRCSAVDTFYACGIENLLLCQAAWKNSLDFTIYGCENCVAHKDFTL